METSGTGVCNPSRPIANGLSDVATLPGRFECADSVQP